MTGKCKIWLDDKLIYIGDTDLRWEVRTVQPFLKVRTNTFILCGTKMENILILYFI